MKDILKTIPPELIALLVIILGFMALILFTDKFYYDRETYLQAEFERLGGCAFSQCPARLQERTLAETGGVYPPQYYERHSKEWWHSVCTYSPEECH